MEVNRKHRLHEMGLDAMITDAELRRKSSQKNIRLDLIEKDYILGWIIYGISKTSKKDQIAFKGGTALSKIYFPLNWRISEDLDFTITGSATTKELSESMINEIPENVIEQSNGIRVEYRDHHINNDFLRLRFAVEGPITRHTARAHYDYPDFNINTYTLENILAEKIRSMIERDKIRDYYDTWRLLQIEPIDHNLTASLFQKKCEGKGIKYRNINQILPEDIKDTLQPYYDSELLRLTGNTMPSLETIIQELSMELRNLNLSEIISENINSPSTS